MYDCRYSWSFCAACPAPPLLRGPAKRGEQGRLVLGYKNTLLSRVLCYTTYQSINCQSNNIMEELIIIENVDAINAAEIVKGNLPENLHGSFDTLYRSIRAQMLDGTFAGRNLGNSRTSLDAQAAQLAADTLLNIPKP